MLLEGKILAMVICLESYRLDTGSCNIFVSKNFR